VELSNFHFFSEKYTVYVTRFRFAYLFLSEYVEKVNMLPFDRSPDDKHMNLRALFLNRLPFGIGKRLLGLVDVQQPKNIMELMDVTDTAIAHVQKQHDMIKRTNRALLGEDKYESKYGKFDRSVVPKKPYASSKDRKPSVDTYSRQNDEDDVVDHYYDPDDSSSDEEEFPYVAVEELDEQYQGDETMEPTNSLVKVEGTTHKPLFPKRDNKDRGKPFKPNSQLKPDAGLKKPPIEERKPLIVDGKYKGILVPRDEFPRCCWDMYFNATCKYGPKCIYCAPEGEIDKELRRLWVAVTHIQISHRARTMKDKLT
jgi:hypothetical protein